MGFALGEGTVSGMVAILFVLGPLFFLVPDKLAGALFY